jgi:2-methylcitrate synthase
MTSKTLAENCQFEEVAYLIFFGELPTAAQLTAYKAKLKSLRQLPQALKEVLSVSQQTHTQWM